MNRIYKLKFDKRRNELVVVSEITTGVGNAKATGSVEGEKSPRRGVRAMALSLLSGMMIMAHPAMSANLPTGGQIVAGSGSIQTPSGNQMNIHQSSQNMVANWNSFDIGKGNTVQFYQPNSSAVALNRVVGGGESQIMGNLKANGQVFLVNPSGVLFGKGASVSTSGFVASTRDIKNDDFMNRRYTFSGGQKAGAAIVNQGALTTNAGGYIVLAADRVSNSGTIRTPGGKTVLAASERVTLQLDNGGLMSAQVTGDVVNALVENRGLVSARDGQVYLTALGRDMLMNTVLNVSGVVEAGGMHRQDGNIVLDGGDSGVVHLSGTLQADNASGQGGKVVVQGKNILLDKGSSITATGGQGGGEVYVGGGWQGKDSNIRNADKVVMQDGARIDVSATQQGNGGTAVLWSDSYTNFHGQISAKGGETGGNGGQVETSSHGNLQAFGTVSASAKKGKAGNWLLDSADITIVNGSNDSNVSKTETTQSPPHTQFAPTAAGSAVSNTSINNRLNNGTSVTIRTGHTTKDGAQKGNITVNAAINKSNGSDANLTLQAGGNITVNNSITSTSGKLNVNLSGANTNNGSITISNNVNITTSGGSITIGTANASNSVNISINNTTLNASNGNIQLTGTGTGNDSGILFNGCNTLTASNITLTGSSTSGNAINLTGTATLNATNNITLTGSSTSGNAINLKGNNTLTASNITLTGESTSGNAINLTDTTGTTTLNATNNITMQGTRVQIKHSNITAGNFALNATVAGSEISNTTLTATNNINLTAKTNSASSGVYLKDARITSTNGNITANGTATANGKATHLDNNVTLNASNGRIKLTGNGYGHGSASGILFAGNNRLTASNIALTGNSTSGNAINLTDTATLTASNITLTGSSTSGNAINLTGTATLNATNNITLTGSSTSGNAINLKGNNTLTARNITLTGESTSGNAINLTDTTGTTGTTTLNATNNITMQGTRVQIKHSNITAGNFALNATVAGSEISNTTLTATNNINLTAKTNSASSGVYLKDARITSTNGNITANGTATANGKATHLDNNVTLNASNGRIKLTGNGYGHGSASGILFAGNNRLTASNITLTGSSTSGNAINLTGTATLNATNNITLTGSSTSGNAINLKGNNRLTARNITLTGESTSGNAINLTDTTGTTTLNATNNITMQGTRIQIKHSNITAGNFALNATVAGSEISNTTLTATNNINLTAKTNSASSGVYLKDARITSTNGNITANGTARANDNATYLDGNVTLNASNGSIKLTGIGNGSTSGILFAGNNTLTASNITLTGESTSGNAINLTDTTGTTTLNATNNITMQGTRVQIKHSNITAGNFALNATVAGSEISNTTLTATNNINLTAKTNSASSGVYLKDARITSTNGNITANGTARANDNATYLDGNVTLNASNGSIKLTGIGNGSTSGILFAGNNTLTASNITLTGNSEVYWQ
ncbi:filamentous hemagglutinin family N-terminal domain protein [Escherichia coli Jurua 18/11]|uniref:two-partner secretion domain-containing protein n=1 Tax=Escherichia coli TaxID=562 RepID=UPI0002CBC16E|nr:filamentous hemagglutinin N-terminal domain-containing protein [Escherichia coli]EMX66921.1 filamentous hemagglutinin family N-terminal domain protein [Escherichia coli Jurua 18/11]